mmetsp:Transcript_48340/g.121767  ORF Transcript_48340/g.121767 Transcript_48340/m.121767 type:complete len:182 (-) Transcript_48340:46-591(-)
MTSTEAEAVWAGEAGATGGTGAHSCAVARAVAAGVIDGVAAAAAVLRAVTPGAPVGGVVIAAGVRGLGATVAEGARAAEVEVGRARAKTGMYHSAFRTLLASASGATSAVNDILVLMTAGQRERACRARNAASAINASVGIASSDTQKAPGMIRIGDSVAMLRDGAVSCSAAAVDCRGGFA